MDSKNYVYKCRLRRVIDGDTVVCDVNLGFDVVLVNQKVMLAGMTVAKGSRGYDI